MSLFQKGEYFPHPDHDERIETYRDNKQLFLGNHFDIFVKKYGSLSGEQQQLLDISTNIAGLVCMKSADMLFGEQPTFTAGKKSDSLEQKRLEKLISENQLHQTNYESAMSNSYRGDSFYKLRYGQLFGGKYNTSIDPFRVVIESQKAEYVFPEVLPGTNRIFAYHIAIPKVVDNTGDEEWVLDVESHYPGKLVYSQYGLEPLSFSSYENRVVTWKILDENKTMQRKVPTGINKLLVFHVPNFKTDDETFGINDLDAHKGLLAELNNRLGRIAHILDVHSEPIITVPEGALAQDDEGNKFYDETMKAIELKEGDKVAYVVWNAQLEYAFKELEFVLEQLLVNMEMPKVALGMNDSGTSGSSSLAIKNRMSTLLSKISRKRMYYDQVLKDLIETALELEHKKIGASKAGYEIFRPLIHWNDGLPSDELQEANIENVRTAGKPTMSQKTAMMKRGMTEEQAELELQRIKDEEEAEMIVTPSINKNRNTTTLQDPNVNSNPDKKGFEE
ncbi:phage portal protein [Alkalihalobacillus macyae]|uniref:phage portal protein n=1 Tax=Guptibacillus hwajinpoensis TaxID=208199 RepID=UPI00273B19E1|nr:phage portal protein [Alkalihalobacillus macyae]MDP4549838.1 phage portal protein [Alkalihalobacillus macyae]